MTGFVRYWADVLHGLGAVLLATGCLLSLAAQSKNPGRRGDGLTWRVRFMVRYRRQPRLWGGAIACVVAGLIFYICYLAVRFG
jgi:hypothetical protein